MRMLKMKYILFAAFLLSAAGVSAQKAERDYIRKGNRLFNDSCLLYTSPSPRDYAASRMPSSA